MKTLVSKLTTLLATAAIPLSGVVVADCTSVQVGVGYRQDTIHWKVHSPKILVTQADSDLHFKDLEIFVLGGKVKTMLGCCGYARASFDWGWVLDGRLRDSENFYNIASVDSFCHSGVASTGTFYDSTVHNHVKRGGNSYVWDLNIALGYPLHCWCDEFQIAPTVGFNWNRQHIKTHDRCHIYDGFNQTEITALGLDTYTGNSSKYEASWWGPWLGFDFSYITCEGCNFYGEVEFHFGRSRRERHANTGFAFLDDYDRTKWYWGPSFKLGSNYVFCENWYLDGSIYYARWFSNRHRDNLTWDTATVRLDLGYVF